MAQTISKSDFQFVFKNYGLYSVTYTSPRTGKSWQAMTNNMYLIDRTKNTEEPTIKDLNSLKSICKSDYK